MFGGKLSVVGNRISVRDGEERKVSIWGLVSELVVGEIHG